MDLFLIFVPRTIRPKKKLGFALLSEIREPCLPPKTQFREWQLLHVEMLYQAP
jgi:hypothetical protein